MTKPKLLRFVTDRLFQGAREEIQIVGWAAKERIWRRAHHRKANADRLNGGHGAKSAFAHPTNLL